MASLLPDAARFAIDRIGADEKGVIIFARSRLKTGICPVCGFESRHIHSFYDRTVQDLGFFGQPARLHLRVHKFFCNEWTCRQRVFVERIPTVVARYGRKTNRLERQIQEIGLRVGGNPGERLSLALGRPTSRNTILRRTRAATRPSPSTPRILGIDDFAFRRGENYGTILVDHETGKVVDVIEGREAETISKWLNAHSGVEEVTRDGSPAYAEGIRRGAPDAKQIGDRWHILENLTDTFEDALRSEWKTVKQVLTVPRETPVDDPPLPEPVVEPTPSEYVRSGREKNRRQEFHRERKACFDKVKQLKAQGLEIFQISRGMGISYGKAKSFFEAAEYPVIRRGRNGSLIDPFVEYLAGRWNEGCRNGIQLHQEIKKLGFKGSKITVRRLLIPWRQTGPTRAIPKAPKMPGIKECVWLLLGGEKVSEPELVALRERLLSACPGIRKARELVLDFHKLIATKNIDAFPTWLESVAESGIPAFKHFINGIKRDEAAVRNAITEKWSNGRVEGHVNRLKVIKRQMYGRGKLDLLRARVLFQDTVAKKKPRKKRNRSPESAPVYLKT